jgi:hypothetical protein
MHKSVLASVLAASMLAATAGAQQESGFDPEACARHCREMAATRQKAMDACRARQQERQAAWKEIQAALETARATRGDKKVAALESAVQKLVALESAAPCPMGGPAGCPMMGDGPGHGPHHGMAGGAPGCCGGGGPAGKDCPMMKGGSAPPPGN